MKLQNFQDQDCKTKFTDKAKDLRSNDPKINRGQQQWKPAVRRIADPNVEKATQLRNLYPADPIQ